ncbi:MAG: SIS domain-containing protein [bacterium]|nr:SIS domain-containing protein [bacterium]
MTDDEFIRTSLEASAAVKQAMISACTEPLQTAADWISAAMLRGNSLLICGNGGSAADSQHIATEFVVRLSAENPRGGLPAIALTTDSSTLTAAANDFGFDYIFSRQVEALGRPGDVLIGISTSGKSPNVVLAAKAARDKGIKVIAFLGQQKRELGEAADLCIQIPSADSQRVQEGHITAGHLLVALVEKRLLANKKV